MNPDDTEPVQTADGSLTLYSRRYGQSYASHRGALAEARAVFLANSGVGARLTRGEAVRVLEVGFGTGLNFFVTAAACLEHPGAALYYSALEHTLLGAEPVRQLGYETLVACDVVAHYLEWRGGLGEPAGKTSVFEWQNVRLELLLGEATEQTLPPATFHAVYHDAFSPEVNPELWSERFLAELVRALRPGGALVSYCVQGRVRRTLQRLGLEVSKYPGPAGGKREVLVARKPVS